MKKSQWFICILLIFSLSACNLPISNAISQTTTPFQAVETENPSKLASVDGIWSGTMNDDTGGYSYDVTLTLTQPIGTTPISGTFILSNKPTDPAHKEEYQVTGEFVDGMIKFNEPEGRFFWGTADSSGMNGKIGWCDNCDAWGNFSLTRQVVAQPTVNPYMLSLPDLTQGATIIPVIGENGFPVVTTRVEAAGSYEAYTGFTIEADGMWVGNLLMESSSPFSGDFIWTPWHGNGDYQVVVKVIAPTDGQILASQSLTVKVDGIPVGTPTVKERMIQAYKEQFGLTLTEPVFARYTKPNPSAIEESRWVSAAYIGNKLYEINIFDNGFAGGMSYDLNAENGFCRPAGKFSMLVVIVDYGNTGLDPNRLLEPLAAAQAEANARWLEYSKSIGLADPIVQVDRMETAFVSAPPVPGQALTVEEVRTLTGMDPAGFDWLVEIDLDANNSFVGQFGGLGVSLNGGCLPGGAQRVNIAFNASDESLLLNSAAGSIFFHEIEHGMGWEHWWPNGMADVTGRIQSYQFWTPMLLFGWTDTDGDGTIEIYDTLTPYGLVP